MEYEELIAIITSLFLSAFFSGTEIAFVSANKLYFELQKKQGVWTGIIISHFLRRPSHFIATMLVGNTVTLVLYGIYMANVLDPILAELLPANLNNDILILVLQSLLSTLLVLITAEFLPKAIFMLDPDAILEILAIPIWIVYQTLYWPVYLIEGLSRLIITRIFKLDFTQTAPVYRMVDLNNYLKNTYTIQDEPQSPNIDPKIFNNALLFKTVKVRDCMIPRTEIVAVEVNDNLEKLKKAFVDSGHSKILVYQNSIDNVIGYCHSLELFSNPHDVRSILSDIIIVPDTALAQELLVRFISEHKSIALVVDEFGGTSGIVSLEDVVEEIFGEIQDEYDQEDWAEHKIDAYTYVLSARHEIDYLNEKYGWKIPEGDYDTLGGFILSIHENIPQANEVVLYPPFSFTILSTQYSRIDTIRISIDKQYLESLKKNEEDEDD
ncbi:MAG: HlyC/CorC family transporter [Bacteroidia bacterium]|nr:HlyC/CorC family transporter [Bacteroidia bacterium]